MCFNWLSIWIYKGVIKKKSKGIKKTQIIVAIHIDVFGWSMTWGKIFSSRLLAYNFTSL